MTPLDVTAFVGLAQAAKPVLDPPTQAVLVMSLLAFTLLGIALMAGAVLAGRWVRRVGGRDLREPLPIRHAAPRNPATDPLPPAPREGVA